MQSLGMLVSPFNKNNEENTKNTNNISLNPKTDPVGSIEIIITKSKKMIFRILFKDIFIKNISSSLNKYNILIFES